ncbi:MAG: UrcA family protein [Sphingomonadaceae bacterium]
MMKLTLVALLLAAAQPAVATVNEARVTLAGLDLSKRGDVRELDRRLERAAATVCGARATVWLSERAAVVSCMRDALARARPARDAAIAQAMRSFDQMAAR